METLHATGPAPKARGYHSMVLLGGPAGGHRCVVVGGRLDDVVYSGRDVLAVYEVQASRWVPPARSIAGAAPCGRSSHKCV